MLVYIIYNSDENNGEYSFYDMDTNKVTAEKKYKTDQLKQFLSSGGRCDIDFLKMAEVDVSDADYVVMSGADEDCYFSEEDFDDFAREIDTDPKRKLIYEVSGDQAGKQLHQYWIDNLSKYPNIPEDIAGEDDYYFDFMENLYTEDVAAYDKLVDDFIKSGKFTATV
jgi:hypothetical protein